MLQLVLRWLLTLTVSFLIQLKMCQWRSKLLLTCIGRCRIMLWTRTVFIPEVLPRSLYWIQHQMAFFQLGHFFSSVFDGVSVRLPLRLHIWWIALRFSKAYFFYLLLSLLSSLIEFPRKIQLILDCFSLRIRAEQSRRLTGHLFLHVHLSRDMNVVSLEITWVSVHTI